MSTCIYCGRPGPFSDEHVFTRALPGDGEDWVLREVVCKECNGLFSRWERAWTSDPMNAPARIWRGPVGSTRKGQAFTAHPSEQIFLEADGDPIAYEVDLLPGFEPRLRVQIIDDGTSVRSEAGAAEDLVRFDQAFETFNARRAWEPRRKARFHSPTGPNRLRRRGARTRGRLIRHPASAPARASTSFPRRPASQMR